MVGTAVAALIEIVQQSRAPSAPTRFNRQWNIDVDLEAYGGLISASRPVQAEGLGNKISINQSTV